MSTDATKFPPSANLTPPDSSPADSPPLVRFGDVLFTLGAEIQMAANDLRALTAFRAKVDELTRRPVAFASPDDSLLAAGYSRAMVQLRADLGLPPVLMMAGPAVREYETSRREWTIKGDERPLTVAENVDAGDEPTPCEGA